MAKPKPVVDPTRCKPEQCADKGCAASAACTKNILQQDDPLEPPFPVVDCSGCGKCALACPQKAIVMT